MPKKWIISITQGEFPKVPLQPESFNVVTCFDILEYTKDPKQFLSSVYNILKKDELLVVQTPNIDSIMFYLTGEKWNWLCLPNHLYHFLPATLCRLLRLNGLKILKIKTFDDLSEFNFNLIDGFGVKKTDFFSRLVWKTLKIGLFSIAPLTFSGRNLEKEV